MRRGAQPRGKVEHTCGQCGRLFRDWPYIVFCSIDCGKLHRENAALARRTARAAARQLRVIRCPCRAYVVQAHTGAPKYQLRRVRGVNTRGAVHYCRWTPVVPAFTFAFD